MFLPPVSLSIGLHLSLPPSCVLVAVFLPEHTLWLKRAQMMSKQRRRLKPDRRMCTCKGKSALIFCKYFRLLQTSRWRGLFVCLFVNSTVSTSSQTLHHMFQHRRILFILQTHSWSLKSDLMSLWKPEQGSDYLLSQHWSSKINRSSGSLHVCTPGLDQNHVIRLDYTPGLSDEMVKIFSQFKI